MLNWVWNHNLCFQITNNFITIKLHKQALIQLLKLQSSPKAPQRDHDRQATLTISWEVNCRYIGKYKVFLNSARPENEYETWCTHIQWPASPLLCCVLTLKWNNFNNEETFWGNISYGFSNLIPSISLSKPAHITKLSSFRHSAYFQLIFSVC
jgi:hypothetical protein